MLIKHRSALLVIVGFREKNDRDDTSDFLVMKVALERKWNGLPGAADFHCLQVSEPNVDLDLPLKSLQNDSEINNKRIKDERVTK